MLVTDAGRTRVRKNFPLLPLGPPVDLHGGGSRVTLSPGAAQDDEMRRFLQEGARLARLRLNPSRPIIVPVFKLCRTRSIEGSGPLIVSGQPAFDLLPEMPPTRIDLRALAGKKGETLDQGIAPC